MERRDYFALCEKYALLRDGRGVIQDKDAAKTCLVQWEGENGWFLAYPYGCILHYVAEGEGDSRKAVPRYWASLRLCDTLASVSAALNQIKPLEGGE